MAIRRSAFMASEKSPDLELLNIRKDINEIDDQIKQLLLQRIVKVEEIAECKAKNNILIEDLAREEEKLKSICEGSFGSEREYLRNIFSSVMQQSKILQLSPKTSELQFKVGIIGLGLIGGSLYKAIQYYHPKIELRCFDINPISGVDLSELETVLNSDFVVLCTPIEAIFDLLAEHGQKIPKSSCVVDFASTKSEIAQFIQNQKGFEFRYIPAHPIAGRETSGFAASKSNLYLGKTLILCEKSTDKVFESLLGLLTGVGFHIEYMDLAEHDRYFAYSSHLAHLIAVALVSSELDLNLDFNKNLVPQSYKDLTRVSESPYSVWKSIFTSNQENIQEVAKVFIAKLETFLKQLDKLDKFYDLANHRKKEQRNDHSFKTVPFRKPVKRT